MFSGSHANFKGKQMVTQKPSIRQVSLGLKPQQTRAPRDYGIANESRRRRLQVDDQGFTLVHKEKRSVAAKQHLHSTPAPSLREKNQQHHCTHPQSKNSGRKSDADWTRSCRETARDDLIHGLNWQQSSLLKSKRVAKKANLPRWAPPSASNAKRDKKREKNGQASVTLLPPLRFSSEPGKAAWRFVLPSPQPLQANDLPEWCGPMTDNIVVTLGSRRSSTSPSADSFSSDSDASVSSNDEEGKSDKKSCSDGLVSGMLQSLTIYAGPSFSAAAPQPCCLPFPSFLSRS